MYFYDMQQQGPLPNWQQMGQSGPQFAQLHGSWPGNSWLGNPGLAAYGQQYGQYGTPPAFGAFGHNSGWGAQPQWNMQPAWGQQHRQLSPYDVNEVVRQLVPALPQILAQAQQPYPGLAYAAYGQVPYSQVPYNQVPYSQAPRTLTPQDVNDVVRQLLPLLPQVVGALQGQPPQQFAMHGGIGSMGQGHLGQNFAAQNPLAASFPQPFQQPFQQPWLGQFGALGQYGAPQFQSAFGGPQQWGQSQRQLTPQDLADVSRQLAALIPQVIGNLQAINQQRTM